MRHNVDHRKLGRTTEHRIAMLRNQATSLIKHDRIKTTLAKAKELRRFVEKLITLAKKDTLHARRLAAVHIQEPDVLKKLFATIGPLNAQRPGGYTRIIKAGFRRGDNAEEALIELVGREPKYEDKSGKKDKKKAKKEAAAETAEAAPEAAPEKPKRTRKPKAEAAPAAAPEPAAEEAPAEEKPSPEPEEGK